MPPLGGAGRSYAESPGCGLPLGNQTSLWFAVYYLDAFDRRIKERYRVRYYVRYMDDCVILHHDRDFLKKIQADLALYLRELGLEFNKKKEIMPLKVGVDFWGWHYALRPTGKVVRRLPHGYQKTISKADQGPEPACALRPYFDARCACIDHELLRPLETRTYVSAALRSHAQIAMELCHGVR